MQLHILRLSDIKPNFSELARQYDIDRRTVKKYYDGYEGKPKHHNKPSRLLAHWDLVNPHSIYLFFYGPHPTMRANHKTSLSSD